MEVVMYKQKCAGDHAVLVFAKGILLQSGNWKYDHMCEFVYGFYTAAAGLYEPLTNDKLEFFEVTVTAPEGACITDWDTPGLLMSEWAEVMKENEIEIEKMINVSSIWRKGDLDDEQVTEEPRS